MIDAKSLKLTEKYNGKQRLHEIERDDAMFMNDICLDWRSFASIFTVDFLCNYHLRRPS